MAPLSQKHPSRSALRDAARYLAPEGLAQLAPVWADTIETTLEPLTSLPESDKHWAKRLAELTDFGVGDASLPAQLLEHAPIAALVGKTMGLPAATLGAVHAGSPHLHPPPATPLPNFGPISLGCSASVRIDGKPAARAGDMGPALGCLAGLVFFTIATGSSSVFIGGSRAARFGDFTTHCPFGPGSKKPRRASKPSRPKGPPKSATPKPRTAATPPHGGRGRSTATGLKVKFAKAGLGLAAAGLHNHAENQNIAQLQQQMRDEPDPTRVDLYKQEISALELKQQIRGQQQASNLASVAAETFAAVKPTAPSLTPTVGLISIPLTKSTLIGGLQMPASLLALVLKNNKGLAEAVRNNRFAAYAHRLGGWPRGRLPNFLPPARATLVGDPVDVATGRVCVSLHVCTLPGPPDFEFYALYSSAWGGRDSPLGLGWSHNYQLRMWREPGAMVVLDEHGCEIEFSLPANLHQGQPIRVGTRLHNGYSRKTLVCGREDTWELQGPPGHRIYFARTTAKQWAWSTIQVQTRTVARARRDHAGRLCALTLPGERTIGLHYNAAGRISMIDLPAADNRGQKIHMRFTYSDQGHLRQATDLTGESSRFSYQGVLLQARTLPSTMTYRYRYDGEGPNSKCIYTGGDGHRHERWLDYTEDGRTTFVRDRHGQVTTYHHNELGAVTKVVDCQGGTTETWYNDHLWPIKITDALGHTHTYEYDPNGWVIGHKSPTGATTKVVRNHEGHIVEATTPVGGIYSWIRNASGQVVQEVNPCGAVTTIEYEAGRVCAVTLPEGQKMQVAWNSRGYLRLLRAPDGATHQWSYNHRGEVVALMDPAGRTRTLGLDAHGRTIVVHDFDGTTSHYGRTGDGKILRYQSSWCQRRIRYHPAGEPIAVEEAGQTTRFDYDCEGRLARVEAPRGVHHYERDRLGAIVAEHPPRGEPRHFRRNLRGDVVQIDVAEGKSLQLERDPTGRLLAVQGDTDNRETYRYDAAGQLVEAANQHVTVVFTRDRVGRIVREQAGAHWLQIERGSQANPTLVRSSLGLTQRYAYTARGRVVSHTFELPDQASTLWALHDHHTRCGRLVRRELVGQHPTAASLHYAYYATGQLARISRDQPSPSNFANAPIHEDAATPRKFCISTNNNHRRPPAQTRSGPHSPPAKPGLGTLQWRAGRLLAVTRSSEDGPDTHRVVYRRDGRGRLLDASSEKFGLVERRLPSREQEDSNTRFDALGRRLGNDEHRYHYDLRGRLVRVDRNNGAPVHYTHDALGRRIGREVGTHHTTWLWWANRCLHEYSPTGSTRVAQALLDGATSQEKTGPKGSPIPGPHHRRKAGPTGLTTGPTPAELAGLHGTTSQPKAVPEGTPASLDGAHNHLKSVPAGFPTDPTQLKQGCRDEAHNHLKSVPAGFPKGPMPLEQSCLDEEDPLKAGPTGLTTWIFGPRSHAPLALLSPRAQSVIVADPSGAPSHLVASDGSLIWSGWVDPNGTGHTSCGAPNTCQLRFPGQAHDPATGLSHNRFRDYDPTTGEFLTPDPFGIWGGLDVYAPVCDPLTASDPLGLFAVAHPNATEDHEIQLEKTLSIPNDGPLPLGIPAPPCGHHLPELATPHEQVVLALATIGLDPLGRIPQLDPPTGSRECPG